jgi:4,4'-diaponeurosporenoate glycosyltransferase
MQWIVVGLSWMFVLVGVFLLWRVPNLKQKPKQTKKKFSIIIPARNEANRITPLLNSLSAQKQFFHEWLVVDDHSTDQTAQLAKAAGASVIQAQPLPKGWFGKPWACYQGAKAATGDVLMFLDADTTLMPGGLEKIMALFLQDETPLSVQPYHLVKKFYEQFSLFFNLIVMMTTALFTPFGRRLKATSFFGPCQVMLASDYWAVDGHAVAKAAILEDIVLGEALQKTTKKKVRAYAGKGAITFRMYPEGMTSLVEGWTKNFASGASLIPPWLLTLVSLWITGMFIAILSGVAPFMWQDEAYIIGYLVVGIVTYILGRKVGNFSWLTIVCYPIYLLFFVGLFVWSSRKLKRNHQVSWKGRRLDL